MERTGRLVVSAVGSAEGFEPPENRLHGRGAQVARDGGPAAGQARQMHEIEAIPAAECA